MERFLTFRVPHRLQYTSDNGTVAYDGVIQVKYEFTTVDSSIQFQGDVRGKTLLDYYDIDVVWSDVNTRTDRFGSVRGMGMVQRLKLWRDNYSNLHSITVFANRSSRQYHEYDIHWFEPELRSKDDRAKQVRLNVRGRRGSTSDIGRRFSFNRIRPRQRSVPNAGQRESSHMANPSLDIRYLGLQFSSRNGESQGPFVFPTGQQPLNSRAVQLSSRSLNMWHMPNLRAPPGQQITASSSRRGPTRTMPTVSSAAFHFRSIGWSSNRHRSSPTQWSSTLVLIQCSNPPRKAKATHECGITLHGKPPTFIADESRSLGSQTRLRPHRQPSPIKFLRPRGE